MRFSDSNQNWCKTLQRIPYRQKKVVDAFKRHVPIRFKKENQVILTRVNLKSYTYTTLRLIREVSIKKLKSVFRIEKQVIVFKTNLRIKYPAKSELA